MHSYTNANRFGQGLVELDRTLCRSEQHLEEFHKMEAKSEYLLMNDVGLTALESEAPSFSTEMPHVGAISRYKSTVQSLCCWPLCLDC